MIEDDCFSENTIERDPNELQFWGGPAMSARKTDAYADRHPSAWICALAALAIGWFAIEAQNPPIALPVDAPPDWFAAARAQRHVEAIASEPHPIFSAESDRVRNTILERLAEIGLTPQVQKVKQPDRSGPQNILARIKGQGPSGKKALMLCAHYDSVRWSPGAADDAAGVAVVLETLRALKAGHPLDRDVIALFTDGEEFGLLVRGSSSMSTPGPGRSASPSILTRAETPALQCCSRPVTATAG